MTDFATIQAKIDALKAKVEQNSITPSALGIILDELLALLREYDFRGQYKEDIQNFKDQIAALQKSVWPLDITLTVTPSVIEVGKTTSVSASWTAKRDGVNILPQATSIGFNNGSTSTALTAGTSSKATNMTPDTPKSLNFSISITYDGMTKSASAQVKAVYPSYFGKVSATATIDATAVTALAKILNSTKAMTQSNQSLSNQRLVYAYPKSFGALSSVKDGNNFETLTAYTRTELAIGGVDYYVYAMTTPVTASGVKQIYS